MREKIIRTMLTVLALTAGALPGLPARPALAAPETLREESERVLDAAGITRLRVENSRGSIEVRPSADGRIHLRALKVVRAQTADLARSLASQTTVAAETNAGAWRVVVRYPQHTSLRIGFFDLIKGYQVPSTQVRLLFEVPSAMAVDLRAVSGDITTASLPGLQTLTTTSGDVTVSVATGACVVGTTSGDLELDTGAPAALRARSVSGDMLISSAGGPLDAHSGSGDVTVRGAPDSLLIGTVSGDIQVERAKKGLRASSTSGGIEIGVASGFVAVETTSGSIELAIAPPFIGADISSGSGNVSVRFTSGAGAAIDMRTSSGTIDADAPLEVHDVNRHRLTGRLGLGNAPVSLRSTSGDIRITTGGK